MHTFLNTLLLRYQTRGWGLKLTLPTFFARQTVRPTTLNCQLCNYKCLNKTNLAMHMQTDHSAEGKKTIQEVLENGPFICTFCSFTAKFQVWFTLFTFCCAIRVLPSSEFPSYVSPVLPVITWILPRFLLSTSQIFGNTCGKTIRRL